MRFLILILLFALLIISQLNTIVDTDLWCHLKAGEYIVKNFNVPRYDIFSYTLQNVKWIDHEWLAQVIFYLTFIQFGFIGLNLLKVIIISLCFSALFLLATRGKKIIFAVFFILLAVLALGYRSFLRPEMFSYLLLCIFLYTLDSIGNYIIRDPSAYPSKLSLKKPNFSGPCRPQDQEKSAQSFCRRQIFLEKGKVLYILPVLQVVWVNLHGYFIIGPILIFLYFIGEVFSGNKTKAKILGIVLIGAILACLLNPYFYKGALYPIRVLLDAFGAKRLFIQNVYELAMPIKSGFGRYIFFWAFSILSSLTFFINRRSAKLTHIFIFSISFFAAYFALRNMPIFIFLAMPLAAINLNSVMAKDNKEKRFYPLAALIIFGMMYFFLSNKFYIFTGQYPFKKTESKVSEFLIPSRSCDFLEDNAIKGRIFNTIDFGHYIAYRFYPERRIFIDSRTELYKDSFYDLYLRSQNYPDEWAGLHKRYNFEIVLLRHLFSGAERLLRYLYNNTEWALVYYDENSAIFLEDIPKNKKVIQNFRVDFKKNKPKPSDINLNVANFFEKIGETDFAQDIYAKLLEANPRSLEAGNNLALIYINNNRPREALKIVDSLLKFYPKSAELYYTKGMAYLCSGRKADGIMMFEQSIRLNPYLRQAVYILGIMYFEKKDIEHAKEQFIKYLKLDPYNAEVHGILGNIYAQKGLLEKAKLEYNERDRLKGY